MREPPLHSDGYALAGIDEPPPPVGAKVRVQLRAGDKTGSDESELDQPLQKGYAFFAQLELDDWATATVEGADTVLVPRMEDE